MLYKIATDKRRASTTWPAERFGPNQKTIWAFRLKVQLSMRSRTNQLLTLLRIDRLLSIEIVNQIFQPIFFKPKPIRK